MRSGETRSRQHLHNPGLFRREGWRTPEKDESDEKRLELLRRKKIFLSFSGTIREFRSEFNDGSHPFVVP